MTFNFLDRLSNTKIYDSRKKNNYEEYQHQDTSDISIPFDVIEKITKYINMNTENQIKYNKMMIIIKYLIKYIKKILSPLDLSPSKLIRLLNLILYKNQLYNT
jgi:hypothetical protein